MTSLFGSSRRSLSCLPAAAFDRHRSAVSAGRAQFVSNSVARNVSNLMRRDSLVVGTVLVALSLFFGWGHFIRVVECMGYLPISPPISPEYCGGPTPLPYYMAAIFATLILAGLVLITWSIIRPAHVAMCSWSGLGITPIRPNWGCEN